MVSSNLMLHAGGKLVTLDEIGQFKAPPPEGRWFPVPHIQVRNRVVETLEAAGYQIRKEQLVSSDTYFSLPCCLTRECYRAEYRLLQ